jgi:hypothetical protein
LSTYIEICNAQWHSKAPPALFNTHAAKLDRREALRKLKGILRAKDFLSPASTQRAHRRRRCVSKNDNN